jgi:hypothetical protein
MMWFTSLFRGPKKYPKPVQVRRIAPSYPRRSFVPQLESLEERTVPSTLTVSNNLDSGAGSLRAAIKAANSGDTIVFSSSLNGQTITLTSGELAVSKSLDIEGPGARLLAISGSHASRVLDISQDQAAVIVTVTGLTIRDGLSSGSDGGGGGILNVSSTLNLTNDVLSSNLALASSAKPASVGGAITNRNGGTLTVAVCTFTGNEALGQDGGGRGFGGAIYTLVAATTVTGCTFTGNVAHGGNGGTATNGASFIGHGFGGAIDTDLGGVTTVVSSIFTGNQAIGGDGGNAGKAANVYGMEVGGGGAINNEGGATLTVSDCTFTDNVAQGGSNGTGSSAGTGHFGNGNGGAVFAFGGVTTLTGSTFTGNKAVGGSGNTAGTGVTTNVGDGLGGAVASLAFASESMSVAGCTFVNNQAIGGAASTGSSGVIGVGAGGGLANWGGGVLTVIGSSFTGNSATGGAGAAGQNGADGWGGGTANFQSATAAVSGCTFTGNSATGGVGGSGANGGNGFGGGIYNDGTSTLIVTGSTVTSNSAAGGGGSAGAGIGGGVYFATGGTVCLDSYTVANIFGNTASTSNDNIFGVFTICS